MTSSEPDEVSERLPRALRSRRRLSLCGGGPPQAGCSPRAPRFRVFEGPKFGRIRLFNRATCWQSTCTIGSDVGNVERRECRLSVWKNLPLRRKLLQDDGGCDTHLLKFIPVNNTTMLWNGYSWLTVSRSWARKMIVARTGHAIIALLSIVIQIRVVRPDSAANLSACRPCRG